MNAFLSKYGIDVRVDPGASPTSADRKFPDPAYPPQVLTDHAKYFSEEARRLEWDRLWTRTWQIAGRVSDIPKVGDYFLFELGRESFIIVRTGPTTIGAYYNVCHHRGNRLLTEPFGHVRSFVCNFHSWSWKIDGTLSRLTDRETFDEGVLCGELDLTCVRCETWAGFVFIVMDDAAPPLREFLGELHELLDAYHMEDMDVVTDMETDWPANWKTILDAFQEGYHAHQRHPELIRFIDDYHFQHDLFANGHGKMVIPMGVRTPRVANRNELSPELRALAADFGLDPEQFAGRAGEIRKALPAAKKRWAQNLGLDFSHFTDSQLSDDWNVGLFPNVTLNAHPEGVLVMRFRPHPRDPERCFYDVWVLARKLDAASYRLPMYMPVDPAALSPSAPRPQRVYAKQGEQSFGVVLDQDGATVPYVQQGMHSRAFKGLRLSKQEVRLRHYYAEYDRYMRGEK
jgi:phenylpropionate dioxygenase-like ring-hydroxylating dioxygenase large terminal subunit